MRAHREAGADHVVIQPLDDGGGFAPAALGELASVVTELMELVFPNGPVALECELKHGQPSAIVNRQTKFSEEVL